MHIELNEILHDEHLVPIILGTEGVVTVFVQSKPRSLGLSGIQETKLLELEVKVSQWYGFFHSFS